jgi:hypothetical protein
MACFIISLLEQMLDMEFVDHLQPFIEANVDSSLILILIFFLIINYFHFKMLFSLFELFLIAVNYFVCFIILDLLLANHPLLH